MLGTTAVPGGPQGHSEGTRREAVLTRRLGGVVRLIGTALLAFCTGCGVVMPVPTQAPAAPALPALPAIPITVANEDDVPAEVEMTLYNAVTGEESVALEPFELAPGDSTIIELEPTRGRDDAFHLKVNGFVAISSDFAGCEPPDVDGPLPRSLLITVLPNGEPGACPWVEG